MIHRTDTSDIDALLELIQSATYRAVAEYHKTGHGVPSPDDSSSHPLDSAPDALALKKAIRVLEGACERLCTTLAQPMHTIINRSMPSEVPCMKLVIGKKIPDLLEGFPEGLHIASIAERTLLDARKLKQVLRLLATRGCFKEVAEDVFANNRLSLTLLSSNPTSAAISLMITEEFTKALNSIPQALADVEYGMSGAANMSPFSYSVRGEMKNATLFDWHKVHPESGQLFNRAMMGWSSLAGAISVVKDSRWATMPEGATICDIGSGVGIVPLAIAKAHPHLSITLQDLPEPLEQGKTLWSNEFPEALNTGRIHFVPINFLEQAPVPGQDVYWLKHIIHDWPDSDAITILRNVVSAMTFQSRLLIHENVVNHVYSEDSPIDAKISGLERAPHPLLPNYGTGNIRNYNLDINMLAMCNSNERTCEEYAALCSGVGLELIGVWDFVETYMLEFRKNYV